MNVFLKDVITDKDRSIMGSMLKPLLWVLSLFYGAAVSLLRWSYRIGILVSYATDRPVISVGNITAGGVGKTPLVIFIADHLRARGIRPLILTRGYMPSQNFGKRFHLSDEASMIAERLEGVQIMANPNRVMAAREAERCGCFDVFILDDGFQHWRLKRDLEIVAIDATNPFGNENLLPRGILRESLSVLARADLFVLTKTDIGRNNIPGIRRRLKQLNLSGAVIETVHAPVGVCDIVTGACGTDLSILKDRVAALCAIGSPDSFAATLSAQGAQVEHMFSFADHYVYTDEDVAQVVGYCLGKRIPKVILTQKDAVKLRNFKEAFQGISFLVLKIDIKVVNGKNELFSRIDRLFNS